MADNSYQSPFQPNTENGYNPSQPYVNGYTTNFSNQGNGQVGAQSGSNNNNYSYQPNYSGNDRGYGQYPYGQPPYGYSQNAFQPQQKPKKKHSFLKGFLVGFLVMGILFVGVSLVAMPAGLTAIKSGGITYKQAQELVNKTDQLVRTIQSRYILDEEVTADDLLDGAYHGIVNSLGDPYSAYFNYEELNDFVESGNGEYVGIGVTVQLNPDNTVGGALVISVNQRGGAYEAGIQADDILIAADGESFKDMTLNEMVSLMKGPEGSYVDITYLRNRVEETVTIDRRRLTMIEVNSTMLEDQIGYIAITEFDEVASGQFYDAVDELLDQGMEKLVIDLRDNPGGRVDVVCDIINRILPQHLITYMVDKQGARNEYFSDNLQSLELPIVVLVNGNSASASELMTGALKDYEVATVVGTTTFGKGIVQSTIPYLDGTAIKITTAKYYTPNGVNIHGTGIEPDITVELPEDVTFAQLKDANGIPDITRDTQLQTAIEVLNKK